MSHYYKVIVCFKSAIDIANKKIEEYQAKLILEDGKKIFYEKVIIIGYIMIDIYNTFDTKQFDKLEACKSLPMPAIGLPAGII